LTVVFQQYFNYNRAINQLYRRSGCDFITLLKDSAYLSLIKMIDDGKIKYGEIYSLNVIAGELNMSRTPVRDAIQRLCDENRIDLLPSRGFCLHVMTEEEVRQLYHFSSAIEGYCAVCLAKQYKLEGQNRYIEQLRDLVSEMERCDLDTVSFGSFYALDNQFHDTLIKSLEDPYLNALSQSKRGFYDHPELHLTEIPLDRTSILSCHKQILAAILSGDPSAAYQAVLEHADLVYENYQKQSQRD